MGAQGTATVDFGVFPGSSEASVAVTGQASIVAGSLAEAWLRPEATADHTVDEHVAEPIRVVATDIVAATGFTIRAFCDNQLPEPSPTQARGRLAPASDNVRKLYGLFTVAWVWN